MSALPRPARFLLAVAVLDLLALIIVVVVCWLGGWQRRVDYAHGLVYAGMALLAAAGLRYAGSMSDESSQGAIGGALLRPDLRGQPERMRRSMADTARGVPMPLLLLAAGAAAIAVGLLLQ